MCWGLKSQRDWGRDKGLWFKDRLALALHRCHGIIGRSFDNITLTVHYAEDGPVEFS